MSGSLNGSSASETGAGRAGGRRAAGPVSSGEAGHTSTRLRVTLKPDPVWAFLEGRDISQNELARLVGISSGYLSQLMSGSAHPSPEVRQRLLRVLGTTDFDDLFTIE